MKSGTLTKKDILDILSKNWKVDKCFLESLLKVGGNSQYVIFKRIAACQELDRLTRAGIKKEKIYKRLGDKFGYSRIYLIMLPSKYRENFFSFNLCK